MKRLLLMLMGLLFGVGFAAAQDDAGDACALVVEAAVERVGTACAEVGRNQACYGSTVLEADPAPAAALDFSEPGDLADLASLSAIRTGALDEAANEWGIGILKVQANLPDTLPGQNVTFMLLGSAEIANASDAAPMQAFRFSTGTGAPECSAAPYETLVLQNPQGTQVQLNANGIDIRLGSTVVLFAAPNRRARFLVVDGAGSISASGVTQPAAAGQMTTVLLGGSDGLTPVSPPSPAVPYPPQLIANIPFELLPEPVAPVRLLLGAPNPISSGTHVVTSVSAAQPVEAQRALLLNVSLRGDASQCPAAGAARAGVDAVLVIDRSGSMEGAKLAGAKASAVGFINSLNPAGDWVGVVSFADSTSVDHPLNADFAGAVAAVGGLSADGQTYIAPALDTARSILENSPRRGEARQVILLLTDGAADDPGATRAAAARVVESGIELIGQGLGTGTDQEFLSSLSGNYGYSASASGLISDFTSAAFSLTQPVAASDVVVLYRVDSESVELVEDSIEGGTLLDDDLVAWTVPALYNAQTLTFSLAVRPRSADAGAVGAIQTIYRECLDGDLVMTAPVDAPDVVVEAAADPTLARGSRRTAALEPFGSAAWLIDADAGGAFAVLLNAPADVELVSANDVVNLPLYSRPIDGGFVHVFAPVTPGPFRLALFNGVEAAQFEVSLLDALDPALGTLEAGGAPVSAPGAEGRLEVFDLNSVTGEFVTITYTGEGDYSADSLDLVSLTGGRVNELTQMRDFDSLSSAYVFHVDDGGLYRLVVESESNYSLSLINGDARSDGGVVSIDAPVSGSAASDHEAAVFYSLTLDEAQVLSVLLANANHAAGVDVYDAAFNPLESVSEVNGQGFELRLFDFKPGVYQVHADVRGDYTLTVAPDIPFIFPQGEIAPGDRFAGTTPPGNLLYRLTGVETGQMISVSVAYPRLEGARRNRPPDVTITDSAGVSYAELDRESSVDDQNRIYTYAFELEGEAPYQLTIGHYGDYTVSVEMGSLIEGE